MNLQNYNLDVINCKPAHLDLTTYRAQILLFPAKSCVMVSLGLYPSIKHKQPIKAVGWGDLLAMAETPSIGPKLQAACVSQHDGDGKTQEPTSTAKFSVVAIDYDDGTRSFDEVRDYWEQQGLQVLIFTTSSHTSEHHKFKVILPLGQSVSAQEWEPLAKGLAALVGADPAQARTQQVFFAPNKLSADSEYRWRTVEGTAFSPAHGLWGEAITAHQWSHVETSATPRPRQSQQAGIVELINSAYDIHTLIEGSGLYKRRGRKYMHTGSESGVPGVVILEREGKQVVYSHHGEADPLSASNHGGHALL